MRCCHGSTGHQFILIRTAGSTCFCFIGSPDRIDISARRCDFRLHQQRTRNTPRGEICYFSIFSFHSDITAESICNSNCSCVIGIVSGCRFGAVCLNHLSISKRNGNHRECACVIIQLHADGAFIIVGNNDSLRTVALCIVSLFIERKLTAVDNDNLAVQGNRIVYSLIISCCTDRIDINIAVGAFDRFHQSTC